MAALSVIVFMRTVDSFRHRLAVLGGISQTELRALGRIGESPQITPKQLAEAIELTTGSVTALLDHLEGLGWVRRLPNPEDRRSVLVELTPAGGKRMRAAYTLFQERFVAAVRAVPAEQLGTVTDFLDRVARELESDVDWQS